MIFAGEVQFCSGKIPTNKLPRKQFEKLQNPHYKLELERCLKLKQLKTS